MNEIKPFRSHRGFTVPSFVYGTAWKEDRTEALVRQALDVGFRGIDTANQRKHYDEAGVGAALQAAFADGSLRREQLFLQTKFTFQAGQDHRLPYDPQADYPTQVEQSFASSLAHLGTDYLDSYVLHGPATGQGLIAADWQVWRAMEALQRAGKTRLLGVSNVNAAQLEALLAEAEVKPAFVQNRCYARTGWDARVRAICREHDMLYQGFSLLTANQAEIFSPPMQQMAARYGCTLAQLVYRFALGVGMQPLMGATQRQHQAEALAVYDFALAPEDIALIEGIGG